MELLGTFLGAAIVLLLGGYDGTNGLPKNFTESSTSFASNFYSNVSALHENENILLSPFSVQTAGAVLFSGASGITSDQLATGLRFISRDHSSVVNSFQGILEKLQDHPIMKTFNKLFLKIGISIKPSFRAIVSNKLNSEVDQIDLKDPKAAAETMNSWVNNRTDGKITNLISSDAIDGMSAAFIINAIHFKGSWAHEFPKQKTKETKFWLSETESANVKMMSDTKHYKLKFLYDYHGPDSCIAVELPFKNEYYSMVVVVPDKRTGLKNVEKRLIEESFRPLLEDYREFKAVVKLPIFKMGCSLELKEIFMKMGMTELFDKADFSEMSDQGLNLKVGGITHKAVFEMNEDGVEAAASTGARMSFRSSPIEIIADRPFIYLIKGKAGEIYFLGRYVKP